jgi:hypothetical protein
MRSRTRKMFSSRRLKVRPKVSGEFVMMETRDRLCRGFLGHMCIHVDANERSLQVQEMSVKTPIFHPSTALPFTNKE